jgi:hypothetical protein
MMAMHHCTLNHHHEQLLTGQKQGATGIGMRGKEGHDNNKGRWGMRHHLHQPYELLLIGWITGMRNKTMQQGGGVLTWKLALFYFVLYIYQIMNNFWSSVNDGNSTL